MAQINVAIESINSAKATLSPQIEEVEKRFETLMNVARTLQTHMSKVTERDNESVATKYESLATAVAVLPKMFAGQHTSMNQTFRLLCEK
jgi:prefoldin subunit 5